ncbi:hypothetical protein BDQ17DRAFT_1323123 [Cyathus striatus]|nr:hypothetical protein BDQ17DRAFT_1323123 [Cyathus striatus]
MKFSAPLALILAAATAVSAIPTAETNADRLARGLPPMPPIKRATKVEAARRRAPSGVPDVCSSGTNLKCCNNLKSPSDSSAKVIIALLQVKNIDPNSTVGLTCAPLTNIGYNAGVCKSKPACCEKDYLGGVLSTGCTAASV